MGVKLSYTFDSYSVSIVLKNWSLTPLLFQPLQLVHH